MFTGVYADAYVLSMGIGKRGFDDISSLLRLLHIYYKWIELGRESGWMDLPVIQISLFVLALFLFKFLVRIRDQNKF